MNAPLAAKDFGTDQEARCRPELNGAKKFTNEIFRHPRARAFARTWGPTPALSIAGLAALVWMTIGGFSPAGAFCFDQPYSEYARAYKSPVEEPEAQFLGRRCAKCGYVHASELLNFLRSIAGWETPTTIWKKSATRLRLSEDKLTRCEVIVDKADLYALVDVDRGYLIHKLTPPEKLAIKRILSPQIIRNQSQ